MVVVREDDGGLSPVGQSQVEASQLLAQPVVFMQFIVGIVRPVFVHYVADERIVCGRLYAEASTAMDAAQPNEPSLQVIHFYFNSILPQIAQIIQIFAALSKSFR